MSPLNVPVEKVDPQGLSFFGDIADAAEATANAAVSAGHAVQSAASATVDTVEDATGVHGGAVAGAFWGGAAQGADAGILNVDQKIATAGAAVGLVSQDTADQVSQARNQAWDDSGLSGTGIETASNAFAWGGLAAIGTAGLLEGGSQLGLTQLGEATSVGEFATTLQGEALSIALTGGTGALYGESQAAGEVAPTLGGDPEGSGLGMNNATVRNAASMGNKVHYDELNGGTGQQLPSALQEQYPDTEFQFARRGQAGPDVQVVGGTHPSEYPGSTWDAGNDFGDFKPDTESGNRTFNRDVSSGKFPSNTQQLPYNPQTGQSAWDDDGDD